MRHQRVSLSLFGLAPSAYAGVAVRAEELGFDTLWLADHIVTPLERATRYPYEESGHPGYEPKTPLIDVLVAAAHLAALTTTIRLATGVLVLPLRHPVAAARAVATLQSLANGRFTLGIGAGWLREEFEVLGEDFTGRGQRLEEMIAIMRALWSGLPVQHDGPLYRFQLVQLSPGVEAPPIYLGGASEVALKRAALVADGWHGPACDLGASVAARRRIEAVRADASRTNDFGYAVRLFGPITAQTRRSYLDAGFDHVVVPLASAAPRLGEEREAVTELADRLELRQQSSIDAAQ